MTTTETRVTKAPRVPLRVALVALLVALVAAALLATGFVATSLLRGYLRRKVDHVEPKLIHTIRGVGYTLREP